MTDYSKLKASGAAGQPITQRDRVTGYIGNLKGQISSLEALANELREDARSARLERNQAIRQKLGYRKGLRELDLLKAENERIKADYAQLSTFNPDWDRVAAAQDSLREHMQIANQLRAELAGLKTGYQAYEEVNAGLKAEVEGLKLKLAVYEDDLVGLAESCMKDALAESRAEALHERIVARSSAQGGNHD